MLEYSRLPVAEHKTFNTYRMMVPSVLFSCESNLTGGRESKFGKGCLLDYISLLSSTVSRSGLLRASLSIRFREAAIPSSRY